MTLTMSTCDLKFVCIALPELNLIYDIVDVNVSDTSNDSFEIGFDYNNTNIQYYAGNSYFDISLTLLVMIEKSFSDLTIAIKNLFKYLTIADFTNYEQI